MYIPSSAYAVESTTPKGRSGNGDGIAAELVRRAAAQVAGAAGQARGVAAGAGEPLASERARTADGAEHVD